MLVMYGVAGLGIAIVLLRLFFLWYWRVNEHIQNQQRIIELLETIAKNTSAPPSALESDQSQNRVQRPPGFLPRR